MVAPFPQFVNISDCLGLWKAKQGHHLKTQRAQNQWALEKRQVEVHERSHIKDKESIHFLLYKRHLSMSYDQISYFQQVSFRTISPPWPRLHKSDSSSRSTNQPILRRARAPACHCPNGSMPRSMWEKGGARLPWKFLSTKSIKPLHVKAQQDGWRLSLHVQPCTWDFWLVNLGQQ